jgi:hypothetical protein
MSALWRRAIVERCTFADIKPNLNSVKQGKHNSKEKDNT